MAFLDEQSRAVLFEPPEAYEDAQARYLKSTGPHAPSTVRRRLANWSTLTKWRGLDIAFASPPLKSAIRLAVRAVVLICTES